MKRRNDYRYTKVSALGREWGVLGQEDFYKF